MKIIFNKRENMEKIKKGQWWQKKLKRDGYRLTKPRSVILKLLNNTSKHVSAEDIYHKVHEKYPNIGLTTVYRTLDLLSELKLVHKFDFGDGRARYELSRGPSAIHHHHLVCKNCGKIVDYKDYMKEEVKMVNKVEELLENRHNFKIDTHQLHFYGICSECR